MNIPNELKFSPHHLWVKLEGDVSATIGITDYAQDLLGDIVYVEAPVAGAQLTAGASCGVVESVKTASDLYAPLSGSVIEVNTALADAPEHLNEAPYEAWVFRVSINNPSEINGLMDAESYRKFLESA